MNKLTTDATSEWRQHWGVVLAGMIGMVLATVHVYSIGVFIAPLEAAFGWSRSEIMFGFTIYTLMGAVMVPFFGVLIDKYGPRRMGIMGVISYCGCLAAISLATSNLWSWWALWFLLSFGAVMIKPTVWTAGVSSLFVKNRGLALAIVLCGTGIGSSFVPIISHAVSESVGWRVGYLSLAAIGFVVAAPIVFFFFTSASDNARRSLSSATASQQILTGLGTREALLSKSFLKIAIGGFCVTVAIISFVMNLVPIMSSNGLSRETAATLAGLVGITSIIGRLFTGYLLDRFPGNLVGGIVVLGPIFSCLCFILAPDSIPIIALGVIVLGLSLGAEVDVVSYLMTKYFGMRSFGAIFGTFVSIWNIAIGLGPLIASYIYDISGSYQTALWLYIPLLLIASVSLFSLGSYPDFSPEQVNDDRADQGQRSNAH